MCSKIYFMILGFDQLIHPVLTSLFLSLSYLFPDKSTRCKDESQTALLVVFRGNFSNNR